MSDQAVRRQLPSLGIALAGDDVAGFRLPVAD